MNLSPDDTGHVTVSGDLTFDTVGALFRATPRLGEAVEGVRLDGVGRVDSAGLALLLEWQAAAVSAGRRLAFVDAPDDLVRLAALCEADDLLGIARQAGDEHETT